jgi:elongation factor P
MVLASDLKAGMTVRIERQIYKVLDAEYKAGTAKLGGVVKTKLRNTAGGRMWEQHFRPDERIEELQVDRQTMEFLFGDAETCTFMHPDTFEQLEIPRATLGLAEEFLQPGMQFPVELFEGQPINIVLPDAVEVRVTSTAPPAHAQQDSTWKEATLENGLEIRVPQFIATGDVVRVDVKTTRYLERAHERKRSA